MKKILFLALLLCTFQSWAQNNSLFPVSGLFEKLTNHIYTATYTGTTVPKGHFQIDTDLVLMTDHVAGLKFRWASLPDLKFRYGLTDKLEIRGGSRLGYGYLYYHKTNANGESYLHEVNMIHTDFLTLGLKARIFTYNQQKGSVAILAESPLLLLRPDEAMGPAFQPSITLINSNQLNDRLSYHFNAGAIFQLVHPERTSFNLYTISLTPAYKLAEPLSAYAGIATIITQKDILMPYFTHYRNYNIHTGLLYSLSPWIQVRGSFTYERSSNLDHNGYHYNLGMAWLLK
jgi:hypothetical protein